MRASQTMFLKSGDGLSSREVAASGKDLKGPRVAYRSVDSLALESFRKPDRWGGL
jgi:hypothetical protein